MILSYRRVYSIVTLTYSDDETIPFCRLCKRSQKVHFSHKFNIAINLPQHSSPLTIFCSNLFPQTLHIPPTTSIRWDIPLTAGNTHSTFQGDNFFGPHCSGKISRSSVFLPLACTSTFGFHPSRCTFWVFPRFLWALLQEELFLLLDDQLWGSERRDFPGRTSSSSWCYWSIQVVVWVGIDGLIFRYVIWWFTLKKS